MMTQAKLPVNGAQVAGIDISKDWLDVAYGDKVERIDNTAKALEKLARQLTRAGITTVGIEPTGGYERLAVATLREAGIAVLQVDSWRCRQFAKACGTRAKTDALDARVIRTFVIHKPPRPFPEPSQTQHQLVAWVREVARAEADIRRLHGRLHHLDLPAIVQRIEAEIAVLRDTVAEAEGAIEALLEADKPTAAKAEIITSVPGLAHKTSRVVLAELPELGTLDGRTVAALCGLAPYQRDSGRKTGNAAIAAGRAALKRALYLAAFAAKLHNPWAKALYQRLRQKGKSPKVATIAIARRLITILNAMVRDNEKWNPQKMIARP